MNRSLRAGVSILVMLAMLTAVAALLYEPGSAAARTMWITEIVDSTIATGYGLSLAFHNSGNPDISYVDFLDRDLKFTRWDIDISCNKPLRVATTSHWI